MNWVSLPVSTAQTSTGVWLECVLAFITGCETFRQRANRQSKADSTGVSRQSRPECRTVELGTSLFASRAWFWIYQFQSFSPCIYVGYESKYSAVGGNAVTFVHTLNILWVYRSLVLCYHCVTLAVWRMIDINQYCTRIGPHLASHASRWGT